MKLPSKIALPGSLAIAGFAEILQIAIGDWFLWLLLFVVITFDTFVAVVAAIVNRRFDLKRLKGYFKNVTVMVGGLMFLSFMAAAYYGRAGAGHTSAFIRDFVGIGLTLWVFASTMLKFGKEGAVFMRLLDEARERLPIKGNGGGRRYEEDEGPHRENRPR